MRTTQWPRDCEEANTASLSLQLLEYIESLAEVLVEQGNLDGVLLTGDVQTVSVAALQSYPSPLSSSPRAQLWVDHYRHLLDQWQLWYQR
ncbi:hypothetical protein HPB51_012696 [Rhipicephalus microplus]|uniref:Uncharacterized protein n=1 Tax=Rhipicephalus microplus TaxID=6941 RepID=A0A9J6D4T0_RHIMP|nr:hypothetical protein HPB51_012696 [Rhipicephalus microplus]